MQKTEQSTTTAFDRARDQRAETIRRLSAAERERIDEISRSAEERKAELREEQAQRRDSDMAAERSRLLLERPALTLELGEKATPRDLTSEELDGMAAYGVDRRNAVMLASIDANADIAINHFINQQEQAKEASLTSTFDKSSERDGGDDRGHFWSPSSERDGGRER